MMSPPLPLRLRLFRGLIRALEAVIAFTPAVAIIMPRQSPPLSDAYFSIDIDVTLSYALMPLSRRYALSPMRGRAQGHISAISIMSSHLHIRLLPPYRHYHAPPDSPYDMSYALRAITRRSLSPRAPRCSPDDVVTLTLMSFKASADDATRCCHYAIC